MKKTNIIKLILGNLVILLVLLSLVEIVLRSMKFETYPGPKPHIVVQPGGKFFQKDSLLGYKQRAGKYKVELRRNYEFTTHHDAETLRITSPITQEETKENPEIWILGCSFTHGWSINDEETFAWILQSKLEEYKVVNWGVNGYGTIHFYLQLKEALKKRNTPKVVVINHADFHFERNTFSYGRRRGVSKWNFLGNLNQPYVKLDNNKNMNMIYSDVEYDVWSLSKYSALAYYCEIKWETLLDYTYREKAEDITKMLLSNIVSLCQEHQVQLVFTNIWEDAKFIQEYSLEKGIPFIDIAVNLHKKGATNHPYDGHPSFQSNQIYADKLYTLLKDQLIEEEGLGSY